MTKTTSQRPVRPRNPTPTPGTAVSRLALLLLVIPILAPTVEAGDLPPFQIGSSQAVEEVRMAVDPSTGHLLAVTSTWNSIYYHHPYFSSDNGYSWTATAWNWPSTKADCAVAVAGDYFYMAYPEGSGLTVYLRRYSTATGDLDPHYNGGGNEVYELPVTRPAATRVEEIEMATSDGGALQVLITFSDGSLQAFSGATHPVELVVGNLNGLRPWTGALSIAADRNGGSNRLVYSYVDDRGFPFVGRITTGGPPIFLPIAVDITPDTTAYFGIDDRTSIAADANHTVFAVEWWTSPSDSSVLALRTERATEATPIWDGGWGPTAFGNPARHATVIADPEGFVVAGLRSTVDGWKFSLTRITHAGDETHQLLFTPSPPVQVPSPLQVVHIQDQEYGVAYLSPARGTPGNRAYYARITLPSTTVFSDGFGTGSLSRWSSTVP